MASLLYVATNGSENPTKAALPFVGAQGAIEAGHEVQLVLMGDATILMKEVVANAVTPVGWPPLKELFAAAVQNKTPIHI
jgi:predicted peroxiredoxin